MAELKAWSEQAKFGEQKELAKHHGVSPQMLNNWIAGRKAPNIEDGIAVKTRGSGDKVRVKQKSLLPPSARSEFLAKPCL
jgi:DNA-binding transcriptional regulator YdaS (Cro superfamily)